MSNEVILGTAGTIISLLLVVIGYFLSRHIGKVDKLTDKVNLINAKLATIETRVNFNSSQFLNLEQSIRKQIRDFAENSSSSISTAIMVGKEDKQDTRESIKTLNQEVAKLHIKLGVITQMQREIKNNNEQLGKIFLILNNHNESIKQLKSSG